MSRTVLQTCTVCLSPGSVPVQVVFPSTRPCQILNIVERRHCMGKAFRRRESRSKPRVIEYRGAPVFEEMHVCRAQEPGDMGKREDADDTKSSSIDLNLPRRSMLVSFTCNKCGGRSERLVNPLAWEKGMVIVQCEHCSSWHKIADAANMVEEYIFTSDDE